MRDSILYQLLSWRKSAFAFLRYSFLLFACSENGILRENIHKKLLNKLYEQNLKRRWSPTAWVYSYTPLRLSFFIKALCTPRHWSQPLPLALPAKFAPGRVKGWNEGLPLHGRGGKKCRWCLVMVGLPRAVPICCFMGGVTKSLQLLPIWMVEVAQTSPMTESRGVFFLRKWGSQTTICCNGRKKISRWINACPRRPFPWGQVLV